MLNTQLKAQQRLLSSLLGGPAGPGWLAAATGATPSDMAVGCHQLRELMADELKKLELF